MKHIHPLKEIKDLLDGKMSQQSAAAQLGISIQYLNNLINSQRGVSARVALKAEKAFDVSALEILKRQAIIDLDRERDTVHYPVHASH